MNNEDDNKIINVRTDVAFSLQIIKDTLDKARPNILEPEVVWSALMIAMVNPAVTSDEAPMMIRRILEAAESEWDI